MYSFWSFLGHYCHLEQFCIQSSVPAREGFIKFRLQKKAMSKSIISRSLLCTLDLAPRSLVCPCLPTLGRCEQELRGRGRARFPSRQSGACWLCGAGQDDWARRKPRWQPSPWSESHYRGERCACMTRWLPPNELVWDWYWFWQGCCFWQARFDSPQGCRCLWMTSFGVDRECYRRLLIK